MPGNLKPQTLRGFNDWFAADVKLREFVIGVFKETFEKYGYEPLETPALEYTEFMLGISGSEAEKQFYRFRDPGNRDVMLKYEVMTGMCRAVAANIQNIVLPYKRYQIQPVWRAENTQKGRYRQFTQCDADTIGSSSILADAEFIQMGLEITQKLGFIQFQARISNRKFLNGLREYLKIDPQKFYGMCMSIDKLQKIGSQGVEKELTEKRGIESSQVTQILSIVNSSQSLQRFDKTIGQTESGKQGLQEINQIFDYLETSKVNPQLYRFDPSLARGLASYTGPIWEFEVIDGNVGSIAGCGRYDNLIGQYLGNKTTVPATGGSFGIERICDILKDRQILNLGATNTQVLVAIFSPDTQTESVKLANELRQANINTLLYPTPEKLSKQFKYASDKNIPYVAVLGPDELKTNQVTLKDMTTGEQQTYGSTLLISGILSKSLS